MSVSDRIRGNKDQDETKEGNYFSLMNMWIDYKVSKTFESTKQSEPLKSYTENEVPLNPKPVYQEENESPFRPQKMQPASDLMDNFSYQSKKPNDNSYSNLTQDLSKSITQMMSKLQNFKDQCNNIETNMDIMIEQSRGVNSQKIEPEMPIQNRNTVNLQSNYYYKEQRQEMFNENPRFPKTSISSSLYKEQAIPQQPFSTTLNQGIIMEFWFLYRAKT